MTLTIKTNIFKFRKMSETQLEFHHKVLQTEGSEQQTLILSQSGGQKSEAKVSAGLDAPEHPPQCADWPSSLSVPTWSSVCACLCPNLFTGTPVILHQGPS